MAAAKPKRVHIVRWRSDEDEALLALIKTLPADLPAIEIAKKYVRQNKRRSLQAAEQRVFKLRRPSGIVPHHSILATLPTASRQLTIEQATGQYRLVMPDGCVVIGTRQHILQALGNKPLHSVSAAD